MTESLIAPIPDTSGARSDAASQIPEDRAAADAAALIYRGPEAETAQTADPEAPAAEEPAPDAPEAPAYEPFALPVPAGRHPVHHRSVLPAVRIAL